jgi:hypothetical protein
MKGVPDLSPLRVKWTPRLGLVTAPELLKHRIVVRSVVASDVPHLM